jgi:hypothetical protein
MSLFNYLENLRKKPIAYRKRVAVFGAAILSGLIFLIWLSTFNAGMANIADPKTVSEDLKPFEEIKSNIVSFYNSVKEASGNLFGSSASSSVSKN